jgi:hypothetical protein
MAHRELHRSGRARWLRAAVLGADDGILSTASLVIGVAAAAASQNTVLLAGVAGLVAGATSMAAGGGHTPMLIAIALPRVGAGSGGDRGPVPGRCDAAAR